MNIGPANIIECPHCKKHKEIINLLSGNTFRSRYWTDQKKISPMLVRPYFIQKCPFCGKYFFLNEDCLVGNSKNITSETGELNYFELKEVYYDIYCNNQINLTDDQKRSILWHILWAFNDRYKREEDSPLNDEEKSLYLKEIPKIEQLYVELIIQDIIKLSDNHLIKAELYREINRFDEASKEIALFNATDDIQEKLKQNCLNLINNQDSQIYEITDIFKRLPPSKPVKPAKTDTISSGKSKYRMPLTKDPQFFKDLAELMRITPSTSEAISSIENEIKLITHIFMLPKERIYSKLVNEIEEISKATDSIKGSFLYELIKLLNDSEKDKTTFKDDTKTEKNNDSENKTSTIHENLDVKQNANSNHIIKDDYRSFFSENTNNCSNKPLNNVSNDKSVNNGYKEQEKTFFLSKLYQGNYSLGVSFWIFGILVFFALIILLRIILPGFGFNTSNKLFLFLFVLCELIYRIIWSVGTVRSGLKHKGSFVLKWLAIAVVLILAITYLVSTVLTLPFIF